MGKKVGCFLLVCLFVASETNGKRLEAERLSAQNEGLTTNMKARTVVGVRRGVIWGKLKLRKESPPNA